MLFSHTVVRELAKVWTRFHRAAARTHLEYLIGQAELSGDADGIANYRRILAVLIVYEERGLVAGGRTSRVGSTHILDTRRTDRSGARGG